MKKGKLVVIGCGGAGINIVSESSLDLKNVTAGQTDVELMFVDTSNANEHRVVHAGGQLDRIATTSASKDEIVGSGGERGSNVEDVKEGVKNFLDNHNIMKPTPGEFYVVVSSLSGGSGSLLAPLLVQQLGMKDIPVIYIAVGDSKDAKSNINTSKSLKTCSSIAKGLNKPISMFYIDNSDYEGSEYEQIEKVNETIKTFLLTLTIFCSGKNEGMDYSDMKMFFNPGKYNDINIPTGISFVRALSKNVDNTFATTVNISRSVTDGTVGLSIKSQHDKSCKILSEDTLERFASALPIILTSTSGYLKYILDNLNESAEEFETKAAGLENDDHLDFKDQSDADGLVL